MKKIVIKALTKSIWVYHAACSPCNNCDIEILDLLTPRHDVERFGISLVGSIKHADAMLVTGVPNMKTAPRIKEVYEQMPKPGVVIAIGSCACGGNMFRDSYNFVKPLDEIIPVDAYVPGCPPKPEAMIMGVVKLIKKLKGL
ncbi:MAG: NADH:ubiquinone oxidoreductase [Elusimicrobia bacterium RIFOXYA2_FULL_39_19]|nr:MAG: NADH:ubiquinone oxidoreductase [Elusimicrobia bacterium RIFOXYA2_FULL_39_19]